MRAAARARVAPALLLGAAAFTCAGCGGAGGTREATTIAIGGSRSAHLQTPGTPRGEQTTPIKVVAQLGARRVAMAFVPVYIDEHGPFLFALDTGASTSLVSARLAQRFHLHATGPTRPVYGITGSGRAYPVRIENWSAGKVALPPSVIDAMLPSGQEGEEGAHGSGAPAGSRSHSGEPQMVGLLGSDVLSRYGKIAVDYDHGLLILDPPVR